MNNFKDTIKVVYNSIGAGSSVRRVVVNINDIFI
jgi:hypothetical protein